MSIGSDPIASWRGSAVRMTTAISIGVTAAPALASRLTSEEMEATTCG
jgi:hypothetical protein